MRKVQNISMTPGTMFLGWPIFVQTSVVEEVVAPIPFMALAKSLPYAVRGGVDVVLVRRCIRVRVWVRHC